MIAYILPLVCQNDKNAYVDSCFFDSCNLLVQTFLIFCYVFPSTYYWNCLFTPFYSRPGQKEKEITLERLFKETVYSLQDL